MSRYPEVIFALLFVKWSRLSVVHPGWCNARYKLHIRADYWVMQVMSHVWSIQTGLNSETQVTCTLLFPGRIPSLIKKLADISQQMKFWTQRTTTGRQEHVNDWDETNGTELLSKEPKNVLISEWLCSLCESWRDVLTVEQFLEPSQDPSAAVTFSM